MWAFLIGLAVSVVKTFATSAASAAGSKVGELLVSRTGVQGRQVVVDGSRSSAPREQQVAASQQLLTMLKTDAAFRREVQAVLASLAPEALAEGEQVQKLLEAAPTLVQEVVSGARPVTDFMDPLHQWTLMVGEVSPAQAAFLRSPVFHRRCPVGGEELGATDAVRYEAAVLGTTQDVNLPSVLLPFSRQAYAAVCRNAHRWPVFTP